MTVPYKLMRTTGSLAHKKGMKAVLDEYETVGLERMGERIETATAMTVADLVGALIALKHELAEQLKLGNRVHLPGLGYFSLAVRGELYEDPKTKKMRLRYPHVRTVNFRPEKGLMQALEDTRFENVTYRYEQHDAPTAAEIDATLERWFDEADYIFVGDLQAELHLSRPVAYRLARRLEAEGRLENVGTRYRKMYRIVKAQKEDGTEEKTGG